MPRFALATLALTATAALSFAQPQVEPKDGKLTLRLTVSPARPLEPLSRVSLQVPYRDQWPGNAVLAYLDCFSEQSQTFAAAESVKRQKLMELPINSPELIATDNDYLAFLAKRAYDAARRPEANWQRREQMFRDGVETLLPSEQQMRSLAGVLKLRARIQIAAGKPHDALKTLTTMLALSQAFETHPTLIGNLIGVAIGSMTCDTLKELVSHPDCPNLFWALSELPHPLLGLRHAIQGEIVMSEEFRKLLAEPVTADEAAKMVVQIERVLGMAGGRGTVPSFRVSFALLAADAKRVAAERTSLTQSGLDTSLVNAMSELQVVLAADYRRYEAERDAIFAWHALPYHVSIPGVAETEKRLQFQPNRLDFDNGTSMTVGTSRSLFGAILSPAFGSILQADARLEQQFAALAVIEGLRYHAAEAGAFPASLSDVKLPLPMDPMSGKPFGYELKDGVATITVTPVRKGSPLYNRVYVVTLRK